MGNKWHNILKYINYFKKFISYEIRKIKYHFFGFEKTFKNKKNFEIFNEIYQKGYWGKSKDGLTSSGEGSHNSKIIFPYISSVKNFLKDKNLSIIVDIGCGDFNIGKNFLNYSNNYIACDVSDFILDRNIKRYHLIKNLEFRKLDLGVDILPEGDVCIVRQVLQHISNQEIINFCNKINSYNPYKYLILTEQLPLIEKFNYNLDKPSGPKTRLGIGSGVILHKPPFNLEFNSLYKLNNVTIHDSQVKTIVYEFI